MKRSTGGSFTPPTELIVSKPFAFATSAARTPARYPACSSWKSSPTTFSGAPSSEDWSTSMIAKRVSGYSFATVASASPCAKPTPMTRS